MGTNQETSCSLKPKRIASKMPSIIGDVICRTFSIYCLSFCFCYTIYTIRLNPDQIESLTWMLYCIPLSMILGIWYGKMYDAAVPNFSDSREACLNTLNANFEILSKKNSPGFRFLLYPFESVKTHIQREKEIYAAFLAGLPEGALRPFRESAGFY